MDSTSTCKLAVLLVSAVSCVCAQQLNPFNIPGISSYPGNDDNNYPIQFPSPIQYPTNNQYPTSNKYPTNTQYPNTQYPSNQYPSNQYPTNTQYPNTNNQYPQNIGGYVPTYQNPVSTTNYGQPSQYTSSGQHQQPSSYNQYLANRLAAALGLTGQSGGYQQTSYPQSSYPKTSYPQTSYPQTYPTATRPDLYKEIDQMQKEPSYQTAHQVSSPGYNSNTYKLNGYGQGQKCDPNQRGQCHGYLLSCQCQECPKHGGCYHFCC